MGTGSNKPLLPRGTSMVSTTADGVPVEWLIPSHISSESVILYLHGGGWTIGWYNSHRWMVSYIGQAATSRALAVDYRLAPENPFPAALDDCVTAYNWLLKTGIAPQNIVIAGDSAGANLTLATLLYLREAGQPLPVAAVCISPITDLKATGESFWTKKDPMVTAKFVLDMVRYYAGDRDPHLPLLSPHYGDLRGLPPLLIHVGQDEILLSDATRLADNAHAAGVDVQLDIWPKMWHVWHIFVPYLPEAQDAVKAIGNFIRESVAPAQAPNAD